MNKRPLMAVSLLLSGLIAGVAAAQSLSGLEIMELVEENQRATTDSAFNRMQLSTCRFGIKDSRITCAERPRIKSLESVGKNYGDDGKHTSKDVSHVGPAAHVRWKLAVLDRHHHCTSVV